MSSKKLYTDIDLNGNKIVNLKADTVVSLPDATLNSERIVYYDGDYYYSDGTGWTLMANVVPTGGTAGQVLSKIDGTNYNTQWITPTSGGSTDQLIFQAKYNQAGGILKGQAVYVNGADGTNITVGKADYSSEATSSKTLGLAIEDGANNHIGAVISDGLLSGIDTSAANAAGDPVWLGDDGNLIYGLVNKPYAPNHLVFIGIVTKKNPSTGEIFVKVQNGFELQEIHDVDLISTVPVNGDVLGYNGTLWVNKSIALWLGFTPENVANKSTDISLGTSNTLYPTQNAVKSYVDTGLSTKENTIGYTPVNKAGDTMLGFLTLNAPPTSSLHAVTKQYVDDVASNINFHAPARVATDAALPSCIYDNGTAGVGATLTATANGALSIDGVTPFNVNNRILVKNQASPQQNGIYVVTQPGGVSSLFVLTRALDADNSPAGELVAGDFCFVQEGNTNGGIGYVLNTSGTIIIGTTSINYVPFSSGNVYSVTNGLVENTVNIFEVDASKVPLYNSGLTTGLVKWDGTAWVFDTNNYVPYTGANANVDLGANSITANAVNVSTFGGLSTAGTDLILQAAANKNLVINTPNITSGATTKIQFGGVDVLELKGPSSTTTITNFRYTNPDNTGQSGSVSSMIIDPGSREWGFNLAPDQPNDIQKEIEILAPTYTVDALIQTPWTGTAITLYVNDPNTGTSGNGVGIGLKGSFLMDMYDGDLVPDPVTGIPAVIPTNMFIGKGSGTIIGSDQAKLSFFGKFPAVAKPSAVTTVQGLANALSSLGLLETSTIAAWTVLSAASNVNPAVDGAYYIINTATAITITLPSPTSGRRIGVKAGSAPTTFFTINTTSGTIDGAASVTLNNQYDAYVFIANGSNWFIES